MDDFSDNFGEPDLDIEAEIGSGAFGTVYRIRDLETFGVVAMKRTPTDRTCLRSLNEEIETWKRLIHENIVPFLGYREGDLYTDMFMPLMDGTVRDLALQSIFVNNEDLTRQFCIQMLQALAYLKASGTVHRDVTADNILFKYTNNRLKFCLADFGISVRMNENHTVFGKRLYTAPDLCASPATDIWSLFITIAYILDAGRIRWITQNSTDMYETHQEIDGLTESHHYLKKLHGIARLHYGYRWTALDTLLIAFNEKYAPNFMEIVWD